MKTKGYNMETLYADNELPSHLQRLVDAGVNGLDIMHGELKNLMLIAEEQLSWAVDIEKETEEAMDSMARTEAEGRLDALVELYKLTYDLSFAIGARNEVRG
jgi:hypothetical protein